MHGASLSIDLTTNSNFMASTHAAAAAIFKTIDCTDQQNSVSCLLCQRTQDAAALQQGIVLRRMVTAQAQQLKPQYI